MKRRLEVLLSRFPRIYLAALRLAQSDNVEKQAFLQLVRPGFVVFDVGANRGNYTILFSDLVGRRGAVHAFEPVPPTFEGLAARLERSGAYRNHAAHPFGFSDAPGRLSVHVPASDFGQASLRRHDAGSWSQGSVESFDCELRTLDQFVSHAGLQRLDFLKMDVEGAELLVLRGGAATLRARQPIVHLEYCPDWTRAFGYDAHDLVRALKDLGYRHFYDRTLRVLESPAESLAASSESENVVATVTPLAGVRPVGASAPSV